MTDESKEVTQDVMFAASERYPGIPLPLAISRYMLDLKMEESDFGQLTPGICWGGIHLERVGPVVQKVADAMYHQMKKSITITLEATDYPDSYDHIQISVTGVEGGTAGDIPFGPSGSEYVPLTGWPCCACTKPIPEGDTNSHVVMLSKVATWKHPTWGNFLTGGMNHALAVRCGECATAKKDVIYALKGPDGGNDPNKPRFELVEIDSLEDVVKVDLADRMTRALEED